MALVKINEATISTAVKSVTLTGIDTTYNVYLCVFNNVSIDTDNSYMLCQIGTSSGASTGANYSYGSKTMKAETTYSNLTSGGNIEAVIGYFQGNATYEHCNGIMYLFNFANPNDYSYATIEATYPQPSPALRGTMGGFAHEVLETNDRIIFKADNGATQTGTKTLTGGHFTLFGIVN